MSNNDYHELKTKHGTVKFTITGEDTVYVDLEGMVVRKIPYRGNAYLNYYQSEGKFCLYRGEYKDHPGMGLVHGLYVHRSDVFMGEASRAAKEAMRDALEGAFNEWALQHKELFVNAQCKKDKDEADRLDGEAKELIARAERLKRLAVLLRKKWDVPVGNISAWRDSQEKVRDREISELRKQIEIDRRR